VLSLTLALTNAEGITAVDVTGAFGLPEDALAEGKRRQTAEALNMHSPQALAEAIRSCAPPEGLLLIGDQFERLYTDCDDDDMRNRFIDALLAAAGDRVKVFLALRADYYGLVLEHPGLERVVKKGGQVTLGRMTKADLRAAIEDPARAMGRSLQPGLVEQLIADVHGRAGDLPLLEFALTELWERDNQKGVLTLLTYDDLGYEMPDGQYFSGVHGAIVHRAETVWQGLDDEERRAARRVLLNLVTPGPLDEQGERIAEDASRRAWQAEWDATTRKVVRKLVDARLLTTGQDPVSDQPMVEVAHEALIRAWPRLQRWLADYRPFVRWYGAELAPFLHRWLDKDRHPDLLLPEAMLSQAEHWLRRYPEELSGPPGAYIQASVEKREREQAARERRRRHLTLAAVGAAVVLLILALMFFRQRNVARDAQSTAVGEAYTRATAQANAENSQATAVAEAEVRGTAQSQAENAQLTAEARRQEAERQALIAKSQELLTRAQIELAYSPIRSSLLSIEAFSLTHNFEYNSEAERLLRASLSKVGGHPLQDSFAVSTDGKWLVTWQDGIVLENLESSELKPISLPADGSDICSAIISPDSNSLLATDCEHSIWIWNLASAEIEDSRRVLRVAGKEVCLVEVSPDSHLVTATDCKHSVWSWNLDWEEEVSPNHIQISDVAIRSLSFESSSRWLIVNQGDDDMRLIDLYSSDYNLASHSLSGWNASSFESVEAFSANDRWVVTLDSHSDTVYLWDLESSTTSQIDPFLELSVIGAPGGGSVVELSPDRRWLVVSLSRQDIYLYDLDSDQFDSRRITLKGNGDGYSITDASFSRNGQWLLVEGDPVNQLWKLHNQTLEISEIKSDQIGEPIAIGPNEQWIIAKLEEEDQIERLILVPIEGEGNSLEPIPLLSSYPRVNPGFSPGGRWLATSDWGTDIVVWDLKNPNPFPLSLESPVDTSSLMDHVYAIFGPADRWLIKSHFGVDSQITILWDLNAANPNRAPIVLYDTHFSEIMSNGVSLLTQSEVSDVTRLWNLSDLQGLRSHPYTVDGHQNRIVDVEISVDNQWLATSGWDTYINLWNIGQENFSSPTVIDMHDDAINAIEFSEDGHWLATASDDKRVILWDLKQREDQIDGLVLGSNEAPVSDVAFSPDGHWLATGGEGGKVHLWDLNLPRIEDNPIELEERSTVCGNGILDIAFSPDGKWLATAGADSHINLWKSDFSERNMVQLVGHEFLVWRLAFSPNSRTLASTGSDRRFITWDLENSFESSVLEQKQGHVIMCSNNIELDRLQTALAFDPEGRWLLTGSAGSYSGPIDLLLWDFKHLEDNPAILSGHHGREIVAAFSHDGRWLVTGDQYGVVQKWDLSDLETNPVTLQGSSSGVNDIAISADSRWLAVSNPSRVEIWLLQMDDLIDLACDSIDRNMTEEEWRKYFDNDPYHTTCSNLPVPEHRR
jgi:WD40 repeat protein